MPEGDGGHQRVAVVEDDPQVASLLHRQLTRYGFVVTVMNDLRHVDEAVRDMNPDLVLLDINLPYLDGFHWCRSIRRFSTVPIVFISSRGSNMDQVFAMENGGDDYIQKPFDMEVVVAKLRALLRRTYGEYAGKAPTSVYRSGKLALDVRKAQMECNGRTQWLTKTELELLRQLMEAGGSVISRNQLLEALWDDTDFVDDNTLTVNVTRLRRKLEDIGVRNVIVTVRGLGYRFASPENHADAEDGLANSEDGE
ncbi:response regulator transcription factor [Alicyclobacillus cycloheptanicus]|uniref:DNA-binding response OmpR family regulator n=1 Tax=Alicyclobacillus cycloheptanicus TaxID=1457 RepID=A0ABT9XI95_9BACL|nr:response regulator transcription factor [Alicyclobacillus cycloheptanicus]MDQ0190034.1 DNA-binding response OmpR family regulator [Alicyclobacillus cycloheptanicus]WDM00064.1 response regulator transcription factor [Alicyclobacillus cycloheptanicus]